jgi:hypothetical protein
LTIPILEYRSFVAFTCFDADLASLEEAVDRAAVGFIRRHWSRRQSDFTLPDQVYNPPSHRGIFWSPESAPGKTAFMSNLTDGWQSLCHMLGTKEGLRTLRVRASTAREEWPVVDFEYYRGGLSCRYVRAMRDDPRWEFFQTGQPLDEENLERYSARRIRDRLTEQDVADIAAKLGWPVSRADFWKSCQPVVAVELTW